MRSSTAALLFVVKNWLWSSLMTFPFSFAITWETRTSSPGLSGRRTDTVKIRSLWISPFWITEDMVMTSIFPPLKIETIFLPLTSRCFNAATVRRPEFSTIILWFSTISRNATISSSSSTVMISSRFCLTYGKILVPGVCTAVPSAIVLTGDTVVTSPFSKEAFIQAAPDGSTPMTLMFGFSSFASVETPVASPPPPIGTRI